MPHNIPCPRCEKIGLVRAEHVIQANRAERHFYCGICGYSWAVVENGVPTSVIGKPPEYSRS